MNSDVVWIIVWSVIAIALFIWLWRAGHLVRLSTYVQLTKEELRKCTWPTWEELKGSTVLVTIAIVFLGVFTIAVDQIFFQLFLLFKI
jgi:preprotein translocase subunit SecE